MHSAVTYQSWGQRLQGACAGVCIGLILFVGSFPLLTWNEGRSIERYETLEEGRKNAVSIADPNAAIDSSFEGKLVYMSGKAVVGDDGTAVSDPSFGVEPANALKLKRAVQMYQWEENKSSHTTKTEGGGSKTVTTYNYDKTWITVGSYTLSGGLVDKINWWSDLSNDGSLSVNSIADDYSKEDAMVYGNGFYLGQNPSYPEVGDVKIGFKYIPEGTVSFVAAQTGSSFTPYATKRGGSLLLLRSGYRTADELFLLAERDNATITWLVRLAGFIMMFIGLKSIASPLEVVLDRIPFIGRFAGDLMSGATSIITCTAAAALSILTIAIAWLAYRPLLTFLLLGIVCGLVYLIKRRVDEKRESEDVYGDDKSAMPTAQATVVYTELNDLV